MRPDQLLISICALGQGRTQGLSMVAELISSNGVRFSLCSICFLFDHNVTHPGSCTLHMG